MTSFTIPETLTSGSCQQEKNTDPHMFHVLKNDVYDSKKIYPRLEELEFK
jgi:hypothetical protein